MSKQNLSARRDHFYCPVSSFELKDAGHLFGIPRLCGYEWNGADTHFRVDGAHRGGRERALFKYTISGAGELTLNGEMYRLRASDAFLLAGSVGADDYSYRIAPGADHWEFLFVSFDKPYAIDIARRVIRDCGSVFSLGASGNAVKRAWRLYELFRSGEIPDRHAASGLGYDLLMQLCSEVLSGRGKSRGDELTHRIAAYCFRHLSEPVTVDELARACGYSRWHFSKLFREAAGMPPSEFVMDQKLSAALQMLRHEPLPVKELAARCGFADPAYFGRRFKRRFGVTPLHFDRIEAE